MKQLTTPSGELLPLLAVVVPGDAKNILILKNNNHAL